VRSDEEIRILFTKFRSGNSNLSQFCKKNNISTSGFRKRCSVLFPDEWSSCIEYKKPKQTQYQLGRSFEYRTRKILEDNGYYVVRSAQSKGLIDLVALKKGEVLIVQCKRGGILDKEEWDSLLELAVAIGATPVFSERSDGLQTNFWRINRSKPKRKAEDALSLIAIFAKKKASA